MSQSLWQWWQSRLDHPKLGEAGESRWIEPTSQRGRSAGSERQEDGQPPCVASSSLFEPVRCRAAGQQKGGKVLVMSGCMQAVGAWRGWRWCPVSGWLSEDGEWLTRPPRPHDTSGAGLAGIGARGGETAGARSGVGPWRAMTWEAVHWIIWRGLSRPS